MWSARWQWLQSLKLGIVLLTVGVAFTGVIGREADTASMSSMDIIMLVIEKLVQESSATGPEWGDDNEMVVPSAKDKLSDPQSIVAPILLSASIPRMTVKGRCGVTMNCCKTVVPPISIGNVISPPTTIVLLLASTSLRQSVRLRMLMCNCCDISVAVLLLINEKCAPVSIKVAIG
jgi:hypothetical protein